MVLEAEPMSLLRHSRNRSRAANRLASLVAAALLAACAGQTQPPTSTQSLDHASSAKPRYDPADEIRAALLPCWNVDPNLSVTPVVIIATLDADGAVLEAEASEPGRYRTDDTYRQSADRAIRAAMNPACQPLPFSAEDWPSWQTVALVFDPNLAFGVN